MDDEYRLGEIGRIVRGLPAVGKGIDALYEIVRRQARIYPLVEGVIERLTWAEDVEAVREAMLERLEGCVPGETTGFYLGIDGLNMPSGKGIEMGCSSRWRAADASIEFIYSCDTYCDDLPMPSLAEYYSWYYGEGGVDVLNSSSALFVEYPVCLGASALVIAHALSDIDPTVLCGHHVERCFAFGFHDGDMKRLGRATRAGFVCEAVF